MSSTARILSNSEEEVTVAVTIRKSRSFLECEELIQDALNEAGKEATRLCLEDFDTDGSPIQVAGRTLTAKKVKVAKKYMSPYGEIKAERYAYQSSEGGAVEIPLEHNARIVASSTPRFARMSSFKYSGDKAGWAVKDLWESHRVKVSRCYFQDISAAVAEQVRLKDPYWNYAETSNEPLPLEVSTVTIGIDGTCMLYCDEGYRQAMVGTIAFYDAARERLHTIYIAAAPEHGKESFLARMDAEIARVKQRFKHARYVGISDGASDYLPWLKKHTTTQILDFWHGCEYIVLAAPALHRPAKEREQWRETACHNLKHKHGAARALLEEFKEARTKKLGKKVRENLEKAITYFENNFKRMNYASYRKSHVPIGSGVTEAACKTLVKQRMCGSGMTWKKSGADDVLTLRALACTDGAWDTFWVRLDKFGVAKPTKSQK
jgi:hypothetical protein